MLRTTSKAVSLIAPPFIEDVIAVANRLCVLGGGCSIPLHRGSPLGVDCTSLPGVADVSCMNGSCYVHKCMPGYQLSFDNSMCMDEETVDKFVTVAKFGWEQFVPMSFD